MPTTTEELRSYVDTPEGNRIEFKEAKGGSRVRGLDRETNKALLLKRISDSAREGGKFEEFAHVLPALTVGQIKTLVQQLKHEGRIHNVGVRKAARWLPVGTAPAQKP